ncbi:hypothetical protein ABL78_5353 [Leptomonas seymouri]|uniref:Transmembrane protein n=1 Tax=Leptomonas seymouri TaxID=5684 RepID=A0A0N1I2A2_LEPSE|nr:hypothetical protein ABL78_5353 [Leptomonas seymouri]|eukprot:KPI85578.1 hypothetical protein ABL78_5353 [Leptomonas seymouri]
MHFFLFCTCYFPSPIYFKSPLIPLLRYTFFVCVCVCVCLCALRPLIPLLAVSGSSFLFSSAFTPSPFRLGAGESVRRSRVQTVCRLELKTVAHDPPKKKCAATCFCRAAAVSEVCLLSCGDYLRQDGVCMHLSHLHFILSVQVGVRALSLSFYICAMLVHSVFSSSKDGVVASKCRSDRAFL